MNTEQHKTEIFKDELFLGRHEGDNEMELFKYYLSNSLDEIEKVINSKIIDNVPSLREVSWKTNTRGLAEKVKQMMNKWDANYSMTVFTDRRDKSINHVSINQRAGKEWLFFGGVIIAKKFFSYEEVGAY